MLRVSLCSSGAACDWRRRRRRNHVRKIRRDNAKIPPTTPPAIAPTGVEDEPEEEAGGEVDDGVVDADEATATEKAGGVEDEAVIEDGGEEDVDIIVAGSGLIRLCQYTCLFAVFCTKPFSKPTSR